MAAAGVEPGENASELLAVRAIAPWVMPVVRGLPFTAPRMLSMVGNAPETASAPLEPREMLPVLGTAPAPKAAVTPAIVVPPV